MKKLILIISIIFLYSCITDPTDNSDYVELNYSPTQCSEKWLNGTNDTDTIANIDKYLKENGITVSNISISKPDGKIYCLACTCPSGRVISLKADAINTEKLLKLGFIKV